MNPGKASRLRKEANPQAFCAAKNCLWRTSSGDCPKHSKPKETLPDAPDGLHNWQSQDKEP